MYKRVQSFCYVQINCIRAVYLKKRNIYFTHGVVQYSLTYLEFALLHLKI